MCRLNHLSHSGITITQQNLTRLENLIDKLYSYSSSTSAPEAITELFAKQQKQPYTQALAQGYVGNDQSDWLGLMKNLLTQLHSGMYVKHQAQPKPKAPTQHQLMIKSYEKTSR